MGGCICNKQVITCQKQNCYLTKINETPIKTIIDEEYQKLANSSDNIIVDISNLKVMLNSKEKNNYEIICPVGQGSYGTVYKVINKTTKQLCAMKIIKKNTIFQENDSPGVSFIDEIKILKKTDHPNIIKTFEYFQDTKRYYIITEYVPGGDLYDTISSIKVFNEELAAEIIYQLLCAVNYLHSLKIVHRDIKPENILVVQNEKSTEEVRNNWVIKLTDFGTGAFLLDKEKFSLKVGTPYYRAPEVMSKDYNEKVDIWSCGIILFILLSGCPPFIQNDKIELKESIIKAEYSMDTIEWQNIGETAKDLVKLMLQKDPKDRISASDSLDHPFLKQITDRNKIVYSKDMPKVLSSLRTFNAKDKLQQATLAYIAHYMVSSEEIKDLKNVFHVLDTNKDGCITYDELKNGFEEVYGKELSKEEITTIMKNIDQNNSGVIEYQEFLRATLNWKSLISEENLKNAFDRFDSNKDNKLTKRELCNLFKSNSNSNSNNEISSYIDQMVQIVNQNDNSEINYKQFKAVMNQLLNDIGKESSDLSGFIKLNKSKTNINDYSIYFSKDNLDVSN